MRAATLLMSFILLSPVLAGADLPPELQQKMEALTKESDAIAKQRIRWESVQAALLKQKAEIEATQKAVMQQQDALDQRGAQHNQQAAVQQQHIQKGGCSTKDDGSGVSGGDLSVAQCDKDAKKLNATTADLNADAQSIQAEQMALEAKYAKANQDASDWQAHESQATDHLNAVYHSMNDWLDKVYPIIADSDFRDEVTARNADGYCKNRGLPSGTLSIPTLKRLNDGYRKCLKYMLEAQRKVAPVGATTAP